VRVMRCTEERGARNLGRPGSFIARSSGSDC
jgi:hypothetical protein